MRKGRSVIFTNGPILLVITLALASAALDAPGTACCTPSPEARTAPTPGGGLLLDKQGNVYGTTFAGGADRHGTAFRLARSAKGRWNGGRAA